MAKNVRIEPIQPATFMSFCDRLAANNPTIIGIFAAFPMSYVAFLRLMLALQRNTVLTHLHFGNFMNDYSGLATLLAGLENHESLCVLKLEGEPLYHVTAVIPLIDTLTYLTLNQCHLQDEAGITLAHSLAKNQTLVTLDVSYNEISNCGFQALSRMLITNHCLQKLNLHHNSHHLTVPSIEKLVASLEFNRCLIELHVDIIGDVRAWMKCRLAGNHDLKRQRTERCREMLAHFLGIRKMRRFQSGMWANQPREILITIAKLVWKIKNLVEWPSSGGGID